MFRLALILFGADAIVARWKTFFAIGVLTILSGAAVLLDLVDGIADVAAWTLGLILLAEGVVAMTIGATHGAARRRFELMRGLAMAVCACLILDFPWDNSIATWALLAASFVFNGALRIASSLLVRYANWRLSLAIGVAYLVMAALLVFDWPLPNSMNVSICIGLGLMVGGYVVARGAWRLRRLPAGSRLQAIELFRETEAQAEASVTATTDGPQTAQGKELTVYIWTALEGLHDPVRLPIIQRYIAGLSRKGNVSTGHAALQCGDIYISHHPRDPMVVKPQEMLQAVRATPDNDVPGKWFPSYAQEVAAECASTFRIRFRTFNAAYLQAFWNDYRRDTTYNLTRRNCSVAVTHALDAAIEGIFAKHPFWRTMLRLAFHPDMWLAGRARVRAESVAWTPGLALDYATALRRVTQSPRRIRLHSLARQGQTTI